MVVAPQNELRLTPLHDRLNSIRSLLESPQSLNLPPEQWNEILRLSELAEKIIDDCGIELLYESASERQTRFANAYFRRDHNVFAGIGGNRSGKSYVGGPMCFIKEVRDSASAGSVYWCVAPTSDKSVSGQQKLFYNYLPSDMIGHASYDEKNGFGIVRPTLIVEPDGRRIVIRFKSASQYEQDPRSFEQEKVSGIWIDESVPEKLFNACQPRVWDLNGPIIVSAIPDASWMFRRFGKAPPEAKVLFEKFCMMDNEANLAPGAVERAINEMTPEEVAMRVHGDFRFLSGLVYPFVDDYAPAGHVLHPFKIPEKWRKWRCMDFGMAHPTVCLWCAAVPDKYVSPTGFRFGDDALVVFREYRSINKTCEHDAALIVGMSGDERYVRPTIIDRAAFAVTKANRKSVAKQYREAGLRVIPSVRVQKYGEFALVQAVKRRLEAKRLYVFDDCPGLVNEFTSWQYKTDKDGNPLSGDAFQDSNNDGLDALKYLEATNPSNTGALFKIIHTGSDM